MASNAKKMKARRANKLRKQGKPRKHKLQVKGTTPSFPLDPPE